MSIARKRILAFLFSKPLTFLALAITTAFTSGIIYWFSPSTLTTVLLVGLATMLFILWPVMYTNSSAFHQELYNVNELANTINEERLKLITVELEEVNAEQGLKQLSMLETKFNNFVAVLERRLNANEATFRRYIGMAEQVYLSSLDNLHEISIALRSISAIESEHLEDRVNELKLQSGQDNNNELDTLLHRIELLNEQNNKVSSLLSQNESALTLLDKTSASLADTKMDNGHASVDAETAMMELERLAKQTHRYAK
jgi:hypothetical protein